jgi:hypothetical protein
VVREAADDVISQACFRHLVILAKMTPTTEAEVMRVARLRKDGAVSQWGYYF